MRPGQQGEFVERQRPADTGRKGEGDLPELPCERLFEKRGEREPVLRAAEGECAGHRFERPGAERKQKHVVPEHGTIHGAERVLVGVDPRHASLAQARSSRLDERPERKPPHLADPERLRDRQGVVRKVGFRGDELDQEPVLGERAQRQCRLERRDAAAGDQNASLT